MTDSALAVRGVEQSPAGAAVDVFSLTVLHDAKLAAFHGGVVDIAQLVDQYTTRKNFACVVGSRGFSTSEELPGTQRSTLEIFAEFRWREPTQDRARDAPGIADLDWWFRRAVRENGQLVWLASWPETPGAGSAAVVNAQHAVSLIEVSRTVHGEEESSGGCLVAVLFVALYELAAGC